MRLDFLRAWWGVLQRALQRPESILHGARQCGSVPRECQGTGVVSDGVRRGRGAAHCRGLVTLAQARPRVTSPALSRPPKSALAPPGPPRCEMSIFTAQGRSGEGRGVLTTASRLNTLIPAARPRQGAGWQGIPPAGVGPKGQRRAVRVAAGKCLHWCGASRAGGDCNAVGRLGLCRRAFVTVRPFRVHAGCSG
jgi:hypothetical protein